MTVEELTDENFPTKVNRSGWVFVDFYASWCGPCRLFGPVFSSVANKYEGSAFYKIDGDQHRQARATATITGLPFVAAYQNGAFIDGINTSEEVALVQFVDRIFARAR